MQMAATIFEAVSRVFFVLALSWYLITNLQWFSYRFDRLVFHHTKPLWNLGYFVLPIALYYSAAAFDGRIFWVFFYFLYIPTLFLWYRKLDKKLVITARVKRFFALILFAAIAFEMACGFILEKSGAGGILFSLIAAIAASQILENFMRSRFKAIAKKKLISRREKGLITIALTASYGKTSLKHFLAKILAAKFSVYFTPGNVNTDLGIAADINNKLPNDAQIYIIEAGARERGDILTIANMCEPEYVIIGKVGKQHIEYFGSIEEIQKTKRELLSSPRMSCAVVHESAGAVDENSGEIATLHDEQISNIKATLEGTEWDLEIADRKIHIKTAVLGSFNAINISLAFLMARELGIDEKESLNAIEKLQNYDHRLQPIKTANKFILDDSYNGNLEGMIASIELCKNYDGRRVIVTPGIVESDDESNILLAQKINEVFDLVLITGALNAPTLCEHIDRNKRKRIFDKRDLETILAAETRAGDLILFANDAPSYV
ncbi:UDP-N-acetylmuramoyl-tripeptide--D-alanyl-D-alanine ligase [Campylobacterota bacterium]|nr:UDP-N-acetylmuramoyl-tripeptide--D-alanyl-D-alanine ligase [Campylobacterota bacterium]